MVTSTERDVSQDEGRKLTDQVQAATDEAVSEVDNIVTLKENEIMQV